MPSADSLIDQMTDLFEQDIRGVHLTCYAVALTGLTMAVRKVRPFSRFQKATDIPNHFLEERIQLTGKVTRIEPNGPLLMIKHKPLLRFPGQNDGELPVKIAEVQVSGLGVNWLQTVVAGKNVKFVAVKKDEDKVHCEVVLPQKNDRDKKEKLLNVGEALVSVGFAKIAETPLEDDVEHLAYYKQLRKAEINAIRKKLGMKYYIGPTREFVGVLATKVKNLIIGLVKPVVKEKKIAIT